MFSGLWIVFSLAFVVALSGALAPGPLLTYTVIRTLESREGAHLTGPRVIAGHALLEGVLVTLLLAGFSTLLRSPVTTRLIGVVGGLFLAVMGGRLALDVLRGRVSSPLASRAPGGGPGAAGEAAPARRNASGVANPVLGGVLVSMSNPYWWVWWATIGLAFMVRYDVTFRNWPRLLAFLAGHEAGDLAWYWLVSLVVSVGKRGISDGAYRVVLVACAAVMVGFGAYLGVSPYLKG